MAEVSELGSEFFWSQVSSGTNVGQRLLASNQTNYELTRHPSFSRRSRMLISQKYPLHSLVSPHHETRDPKLAVRFGLGLETPNTKSARVRDQNISVQAIEMVELE